MKYTTLQDGDILVVCCKGSVQERDEEHFKTLAKSCLENNVSTVLFDWSKVTYFDSAGLENLLKTYKMLRGSPTSKIAICITEPDLIEAYRTLNFDRLIPLFTSKEEALKNLTPVNAAVSPDSTA